MTWPLAVGRLMGLMALALAENAHGAPEVRSVAVFPLEHKTGVEKATAELLTDVVVQALRDTAAFAHVVSARELETLLSLQAQRQLLDCDDSGCLTEIAGQLGVGFVVSGSIGRLGRATVIHLKLLDVHQSQAAASASQTIRGSGDEAMLSAMRRGVQRLVHEAGFASFPDARPRPGEDECKPVEEASGGESSGIGRKIALGLGGVAVAGGIVGSSPRWPSPSRACSPLRFLSISSSIRFPARASVSRDG